MFQKLIVMNTCRTCLKSPANKNISELAKGIEDDDKQCADIMAFCLDIKGTGDSKITTNLCYNCYRKIISFYKFKTLSLKNDAYLKSLDDVQLKEQKVSSYVDENGVKHENFLEPDDYGPNLVEYGNTEIGKKIDCNAFSLGNVKIDDIDVKYEETLGDTETYEDYNIVDGEILGDSLTYYKYDMKEDVASDDDVDGGDPCCKIENILSDNIRSGAKGTATKYEKLGSKKKPQIQAAKKVTKQKDNGKMLQTKRKKRNCKKLQKTAKKIKDLKENGKVSLGPHICEQCGVTVLDIKSHSLTHKFKDERKMLKCEACPKLFVSRGGRRRHFKIHHLGRKAKCDICNGHYVHLNTHIMQVHKKAELRFSCVTCGRRCVSRPALDKHMYTHAKTVDKQFECDLCHKTFTFKNQIKDHIKRVHENVKDYQCEHCSKTFFSKYEVISHLRPYSRCAKDGRRSTHHLIDSEAQISKGFKGLLEE